MTLSCLVVPHDGARPVLLDTSSGAREAFLPVGASPAAEEAFWTDVALTVAGDVDRFPEGVDVHLIGSSSADWACDLATLRRTLRLAQDHAWGAPIYLTIDGTVSLSSENVEPLGKALEAAWEEGIADVLETTGGLPHNPVALLPAVQRAADRAAVLRRARPVDVWKCLMPDAMWEGLFGDHAFWPFGKLPPRWGLLIPCFRPDRKGTIAVAPAPIWEMEPSERLLVALDGVRVTRAERPIVVGARGALETRFLMERLAPRLARAASEDIGRNVCAMQRVQRVEHPTFEPPPPFGEPTPPNLLVTSGFDPLVDPQNTLEASAEVGAVVRALPRQQPIRILPGAGCRELSASVLSTRHITSWLHLSHGSEKSGSQQANGDFADPKRWLAAFQARRHSLLLAVFSTCNSVGIAEIFAREGAAVTVGFAGNVEARLCRDFTSKVFDAAVRFGTRADILRAAEQGACALRAAGCSAEPVVCYADEP